MDTLYISDCSLVGEVDLREDKTQLKLEKKNFGDILTNIYIFQK